ncbi:hypothetical protein GFK91_31670 (plasmid) [Roseibium aggregatum]|uniref:hypothetical protein n=1 Tax=Roseibium aggregatum TaxID=187304 RepID=UPI001E45E1ED|nr:hypothetical protein [Roseibium aggregatum]UES60271.1 hypothetical protein GFK91_31670 [Roseibium aggregatum]
MVATFTLAFIGSTEYELMRLTIPHNLKVLTSNTEIDYDVILVLDGNPLDEIASKFAREAFTWGIDEIRFRRRIKNVASGDPSNNSHLHLFSDKTPLLLTMECDVAAFPTENNEDVLKNIYDDFISCPQLAIGTRIDDYDCWVDRMIFYGRLNKDVRLVSRLSSHFIVYHTDRVREILPSRVGQHTFSDDGVNFYNYEDFISERFRSQENGGIGYLENIGISVHHCDKKLSPESSYYTGDLEVKRREFQRLQKLYQKRLEQ